jgi:hypothetical protein
LFDTIYVFAIVRTESYRQCRQLGEFIEDSRSGLCPEKGLGVGVVILEVPVGSNLQVDNAAESAAPRRAAAAAESELRKSLQRH